MKKIWVIAMSLVSTMALAQHDQQQTSTTPGSQPSPDSKTKTSPSSSYSKGEGTIEGTYQITLTAKAARPEDKGQNGMNASERMNGTDQNTGINQSGTAMQQNSGVPSSQNQSSRYSTTPATGNTATSTSSSSQYGTATTPGNTSTSTSSSSQYGTTTTPGNTPTSSSSSSQHGTTTPGNMRNSSSQTQNQADKNEGNSVTEQESTGNQNMGNTPGTPNQSVPNGSYNRSIQETGMQNNTGVTNYSSLSGKKMILTLKNGKIEFSDKSSTEGSKESKSKNSTDANASDNSATNPPVATTVQPEECAYTKTSGSGANCTITASCKDDGNNRSYWSAYITEGSKINGSVSFVTSGSGSTAYSFTGTRISSSSKKNNSKDTSQR